MALPGSLSSLSVLVVFRLDVRPTLSQRAALGPPGAAARADQGQALGGSGEGGGGAPASGTGGELGLGGGGGTTTEGGGGEGGCAAVSVHTFTLGKRLGL